LLERIDQITNDYKIELLEEKELRKINKLLLTSHTPEDPPITFKAQPFPK
jgi:hypothetical protein